ncbi:MAG TPA: SDR family NAD(P)-dependent oxidoreductase [Trebonia sp.]|jgi:NAD(P)-dependent dehydrogenase (short-subunit alcohol dehydrogenase family)|nr:SDR family NAD(P)-dependent oxidoreductase [Trebonia sp.]
MGALTGKVVVFTGAGAGIGRAVVTGYVAEGARVVAVDVSAAVNELPSELGNAVLPVVADVRSWEQNCLAVQAAVDTWGRLDVFVGNAGITDGAQALEDIEGADLTKAFDELFGVNVLAPMLGVRAALPHLIEARGAVILTGSFASSNAAGGGALYTASKHAVGGLVRQLAYEFAPDVRVNGVAPGVAPTRLKGIGALGQQASDSVLDGTRDVLPTQAVPAVEDYNGVFTLLASDGAAAMTGAMVTVDSGLSIRGLAKPGGRVGRVGPSGAK